MARTSFSSSSSSSAAAAAVSPATTAARRARRSRSSSSTTSTVSPPPPPAPTPADAWPVGCEGYVRLRRRTALTWSTRFAVLRGADLFVFYSKQDAALRRNLVDAVVLASGRIAPRMDLGLELLARDRREFHARVFSRGDLARWVTAFHRLAVKNEALAAATGASAYSRSGSDDASVAPEPNPVVDAAEPQQPSERRRVSFHGSVAVRVIPSLAQEQVAELFYSKAEVERFSAQASSLLSRTEAAVSCARLALQRRAPTLRPWRRSAPAAQPQVV